MMEMFKQGTAVLPHAKSKMAFTATGHSALKYVEMASIWESCSAMMGTIYLETDAAKIAELN